MHNHCTFVGQTRHQTLLADRLTPIHKMSDSGRFCPALAVLRQLRSNRKLEVFARSTGHERHSIAMVSAEENFGRRKEMAIAALMANVTLAKAAAQAHISERTLRRWMRDPIFSRRYRDERTRVLGEVTNCLRQQSLKAVRILGCIAGSSRAPAGARVTAARAIIELSFRGTELHELEERITELEIAVTNPVAERPHERASEAA